MCPVTEQRYSEQRFGPVPLMLMDFKIQGGTFIISGEVVIYECSPISQRCVPQTGAALCVSGVLIPWARILPGTQVLQALGDPSPFGLSLPPIC